MKIAARGAFARFPRRSPATAGLLLAVLAVAACTAPTPNPVVRVDDQPLPKEPLVVDASGRVGGTLRYPLAGEPVSFNYANVGDYRTHIVSGLLTGTLLEFDRKKQQITAGLAKEWRVADDASSVTVKLRQGLRFSDGTPVTADDIVFTFDKIFQEGSHTLLRDSLMVFGRPLKVVKIDDLAVRVEFPEPYAAAEFILTLIPVFPRHRIDAERPLEEYWGLDTPPEEFVGLGPFVMARHEPGRRTIFRHNPHYWRIDRKGVRLPYLDQLEVLYVSDRNSQVLRFEGGELDLLDSQFRPDDFLQVKREMRDAQIFNAGASSKLIFFWVNQNTGVNPATGDPYLTPEKRRWFLNPLFRKALSHAVSREAVVRNVFQGMARAAWTPVPESIPAWHAADLPKYDRNPEVARRLLREAGFSWVVREGGETLVDSEGVEVRLGLTVRSDDFWGKIAALMQQDLGEIGIQAEIRPEEFRSMISRIEGSRDYDLALLSLEFPFDPSDHKLLLSSSSMHFWNPSQQTPATPWEKRIDELMRLQIATFEFTERQRIYHEIQRILSEFMPMVPLVNSDVLVAAAPQLRNVRPVNFSPYALWNVWEIWIDGESGDGP